MEMAHLINRVYHPLGYGEAISTVDACKKLLIKLKKMGIIKS